MMDFRIGRLTHAYNMVCTTAQTFLMMESLSFVTAKRGYSDLVEAADTIRGISAESELPVIEACAVELLDELSRFKEQNGNFAIEGEDFVRTTGALTRLQNAVKQELATKSALLMDSKSVKLWTQNHPHFGDDFKAQFPKAEYDLDEAAKCLAAGRSTAAVFHLMRIMESGLAAIHACLGISVPLTGNNRNWGTILKRIRDENVKRGKWTEKDLFQEFYALLDAVKDAWRNSTMHTENKYTPEEAEHIFAMVRGFMMKISSRMDENGLPKA